MKAILMFDVDEHTYEAMIEYFTGDITLHFLGGEGCIDFKDVVLKPMPQKKNSELAMWSEYYLECGYNACIDEILGE